MKRWLAAGMVLAACLGLTGWFCRAEIKARYYVHKLITADGGDAGGWIEQAGTWGDRVPDRLLDCLATDDPDACSRTAAALSKMDPPTIAGRLAERFNHLSRAGQTAALECVTTFAASKQADVLAACRQIVRSALQNADSEVRLRGAALALRPEIGQAELLVLLLKDPSAEVRRIAVVAVGPSRSLIADDDLLNWLHDPDPEVRRLTEAALRSRGLRSSDVQLGRLLTDPRPMARLEVLLHLSDNAEVELSVWLKRLSEDPSPAVRAATARLIAERQVIQLTERLAEMAKADPDMTVRQTATFHLSQMQSSIRTASTP